MPYMGGWAICVPDLPGLDGLAIELVAGVDGADRPFFQVSALTSMPIRRHGFAAGTS
jgi:hypothetical protein